MTPVRLEPAAPRSRVKHSTTEPLRFHEVHFVVLDGIYVTHKSRCKPGVAGSIPGFTSLSDETLICGPVYDLGCLWDIKH